MGRVKVCLFPQPSPDGRYKANRRSGARTCEPVCRAVSGSLSIFPSLDREGVRVGGYIC
ncbi:hypothetical protein IJ579_03115 [bacterium]|nr:hypothetical protein [bacterium]